MGSGRSTRAAGRAGVGVRVRGWDGMVETRLWEGDEQQRWPRRRCTGRGGRAGRPVGKSSAKPRLPPRPGGKCSAPRPRRVGNSRRARRAAPPRFGCGWMSAPPAGSGVARTGPVPGADAVPARQRIRLVKTESAEHRPVSPHRAVVHMASRMDTGSAPAPVSSETTAATIAHCPARRRAPSHHRSTCGLQPAAAR